MPSVRYAIGHLSARGDKLSYDLFLSSLFQKRAITRHKATNSMEQEFCSKDVSYSPDQQTEPESRFAYSAHSTTQNPKMFVVTYKFFLTVLSSLQLRIKRM
jgi:hypothetical protein